jgi:hypothetical protein
MPSYDYQRYCRRCGKWWDAVYSVCPECRRLLRAGPRKKKNVKVVMLDGESDKDFN